MKRVNVPLSDGLHKAAKVVCAMRKEKLGNYYAETLEAQIRVDAGFAGVEVKE